MSSAPTSTDALSACVFAALCSMVAAQDLMPGLGRLAQVRGLDREGVHEVRLQGKDVMPDSTLAGSKQSLRGTLPSTILLSSCVAPVSGASFCEMLSIASTSANHILRLGVP